MSIVNMGDNADSVEGNTGDTGALYYEKIEIGSGTSDTFKIPISRIYAIGAKQSGGTLWFTTDSFVEIDAVTAEFEAWDGSSAINFAVTAFYFVHSSGSAVATVAVKTEKV